MLTLPIENIFEFKRRLLAHEAKNWTKFTESGGNNKGQIVEHFQRFVDGRAAGEAWCMSFAQFCMGQVDKLVDEITMSSMARSVVYKTEHCLTAWNRSPQWCRVDKPMVGTLMIWQKGQTSSGHVGIVIALDRDNPDAYVWTVEGNTGPSEGVKRDGDGVYLKKRPLATVGNMGIKGWLIPWGESK